MKRQRKNTILYLLTAVALVMTSCNRLPLYSHYEPIDMQGWQQTDSVSFVVPLKQAGTYQVKMHVRATSIYPYTELTLTVHQKSPVDYTERINLDINNDEGSTSNEGYGINDYSATLHDVVATHDDDTLAIAIAHGMARELLPGIADVGITVNVEH